MDDFQHSICLPIIKAQISAQGSETSLKMTLIWKQRSTKIAVQNRPSHLHFKPCMLAYKACVCVANLIKQQQQCYFCPWRELALEMLKEKTNLACSSSLSNCRRQRITQLLSIIHLEDWCSVQLSWGMAKTFWKLPPVLSCPWPLGLLSAQAYFWGQQWRVEAILLLQLSLLSIRAVFQLVYCFKNQKKSSALHPPLFPTWIKTSSW